MNEELLKIINERQLVSVMNKTKWRELCDGFEKINDLGINVRYKLITSDEIYGFSPVWWNEIFDECELIEWMDFNPNVKQHVSHLVKDKELDRSDEIQMVFAKYSIRYSQEGSLYRIWGYLDKNVSPKFV